MIPKSFYGNANPEDHVSKPFTASFSFRNGDDIMIIKLGGEMTEPCGSQLQDIYDQRNPLTRFIWVDFTNVDFINSAGMAGLVRMMGRARMAKIKLVGLRLLKHYVDVFRVTTITSFMDMVDTEVQALAACGLDIEPADWEMSQEAKAVLAARAAEEAMWAEQMKREQGWID